MAKISIGMAFFRKPLTAAANERCVFQAEYNSSTGRFHLVELMYLQNTAHTLKVVRKNFKFDSVADCLGQLADASRNAMLDGYEFDISGMKLLEDKDEDENWLKGLNVSRRRLKLKNSH